MSKIRVIDLLNKIANGEDVPERIFFDKTIFKYEPSKYDYINEKDTIRFFNELICFNQMWLVAEAEIIEEEPEIDIQEIREIERYDNGIAYGYKPTDIGDKINELIKAVKQLDCQINGDKQSIKRQ